MPPLSGMADTKPPNPVTDKYPDLALHSMARLNSLLVYNMEERQRRTESMVKYHRGEGDDADADIVLLEEMKQIVENRIAAIKQVLKDRQHVATSTPGRPAPSTPFHQSASQAGPSTYVSREVIDIDDSEDSPSCSSQRPPSTQLVSQPTFGEEQLWASMPDIDESMFEPDNELIPAAAKEGALSGSDEVMAKLRGVFNLQSFRQNQLEAVNATLAGKDVFVLMPTGGGKSLCYQLPAICEKGATRGVTFVVSPLLALISDQVNALKAKGISTVQWTSDSGDQTSEVLRLLRSSRKPKLVYVTPEKLQLNGATKSVLAELYRSGNLARFVIDEAHCISTWGRDFREAYTGLHVLREEYPNVPIMALTATANQGSVNDIISRLKIEGCVKLVQSFNRKNLNYIVERRKGSILAPMVEFIQEKHANHTGIIYCLARKTCEEVAKTLRETYGLKARHYHAQLPTSEKEEVQQQWQSGKCLIMVATIAFGMGVDKADVRFVIHHSMPKSLEGYYQETGRAGRDGLPADCLLYWAWNDANQLANMIKRGNDNQPPSPETLEHQIEGVYMVARFCMNGAQCRRTQILRYFDEDFDPRNCGKLCDNCSEGGAIISEDVSKYAKDMIRLVDDLENDNVTQAQILEVFRGSRSAGVKAKGHDRHPLYGAGQDMNAMLRDQLVAALVAESGLTLKYVLNSQGWNTIYLRRGSQAGAFLSGEKTLSLSYRALTSDENEHTTKKAKKQRTLSKSMKPTSSTSKAVSVEEPIDMYLDDSIEDYDDEDLIPMNRKKAPAVQSSPRKHKAPARPVVTPVTITEFTEESDPSMLYGKLRTRREEMVERNVLDRVDEQILELLAVMRPQDEQGFKDVVKDALQELYSDPEDLASLADARYQSYGKEMLQLIRGDPVRSRPAQIDASRFEYAGPSASTKPPSAATSVRRSKFKPATVAS